MNTTFKKLFTSTTLLLVLAFSLLTTIPVYADEAAPEAPVEVTETTLPEEEATESLIQEEETPQSTSEIESAPVQEEETPQSTSEVDSAPETSDSVETVESIIESLPEDTQIIVVDESGEAVPLASTEAEQAIVVGDPIWCPATVAVPTPGLNGCTNSYGTFTALLTDPILTAVSVSGVGPTKDGVIWVASNYNGADNSTITISGSVFTAMKDFKLTLKGGWCDGTDVTCVGVIDQSKPSTFDVPLIITGWNNDVTVSDIVIQGSSVATTNAFQVITTGNITVTRVSVDNNTNLSGSGAHLANSGSTTPKSVTVSDSNFSNNSNVGTNGLLILSKGVVTLKNITADNNATSSTGSGVVINNSFATTAQAVNLTNVSANNNRGDGIFVSSNGVITITDMTATNNGLSGTGNGAQLLNDQFGFSSGVTLKGTNLFFSNNDTGLFIYSHGAIKINSVQALVNGQGGVVLDNDNSATPQPVTLTGANSFKGNSGYGLSIYSDGQVTLNNVIANDNTNNGLFVDNTGGISTSGVTLTGTNQFEGNSGSGLYITSLGLVTLNNINASFNSFYGAEINNSTSTTFKGVTLTGVNTFNNNNQNGLDIKSAGIVTLNTITAKSNSVDGVIIDNTYSGIATPKAFTMNGTNTIFDNGDDGLYVQTYGAITLNNMSSTGNGYTSLDGYGVYLNNNTSGAPATVTLNGNNDFSDNYSTGLYIYSKGAIKVNNLTSVSSDSGSGAYLANNVTGAVANITLTGTQTLNYNNQYNLQVYSFGAISISNLNANYSGTASVYLDNSSAVTKPITLSGYANINESNQTGLTILSAGAITITNLSASDNGNSGSGSGASISNTSASTPQNVTLNGTNTFNNNRDGGISISSKGNIKINNLTANNSYGGGAKGANLNTFPGSNGSITLTGTNTFNDNNGDNLFLTASGAIALNNVTANESFNGYGAYLVNNFDQNAPKPVTLTGKNFFNNNKQTGLYIYSFGVITTNNIVAINNANGTNATAVYLYNQGALSTKPAAIMLKGTNNISSNYGNNIEVYSLGAITINSLTADNSVNGFGAAFDNSNGAITAGVTLTGTNSFYSNGSFGLSVYTKGAVSVSNLTASYNTGYGVALNNLSSTFATPKPVTIIGYTNVQNNTTTGLTISTYGAVVTNNITANFNTTNGVVVDQVHGDSVTPSNLTMNGVNSSGSNGFDGINIETLGSVILSNITANQNGNMGMIIFITDPDATGNVILNGNNTFNNNGSTGLSISTNGTVTTNNITASGNAGTGTYINNTYLGSSIAKAVQMNGTNSFSNNTGTSYGLQINTYGSITLSNVTANGNANVGVILANNSADTPANVTFTGKNQMNFNNGSGLYITSKGNITISNLTANGNSNVGAYLQNNYVGATGKVTITGTNFFLDNVTDGLDIFSNGTVTLTKITADENGSTGVYVFTTAGNINLTCVSATNNGSFGVTLDLPAPFVATIKGLVAAGNASGPLNTMGAGTYNQVYGYTCP